MQLLHILPNFTFSTVLFFVLHFSFLFLVVFYFVLVSFSYEHFSSFRFCLTNKLFSHFVSKNYTVNKGPILDAFFSTCFYTNSYFAERHSFLGIYPLYEYGT